MATKTQSQDKTKAKKSPAMPESQDVTLDGIVPVSQRDVTLMLEAGYLLMELKRSKEAEEIFTGVATLLPKSEVPHMAMGNLFFAQGRFSQALKSHQRACELNPESATAVASVAESLFFLKRNAEALEQVNKACSLEADGPAHEFANALKEAYDLGIFG